MGYTPLDTGSKITVTLTGWVSETRPNVLALSDGDSFVRMEFHNPQDFPFSSSQVTAAPNIGDLGITRDHTGHRIVVQFREVEEYRYAWLDSSNDEFSPEHVTPVTAEALAALLASGTRSKKA